MRLEVIERFGGVYIDTDFEALRAIDDLVAGLSPRLGSLVRIRLFLCVWSASPSFTRPFNPRPLPRTNRTSLVPPLD